ncbi:hypothetical protein [Luteimonas aquatica]|uniref:hypothetical protein n=1 Tax=Luteimonas aquatica TaxID=450364 RepID=UPI001F5A533F|nr:hypothetical protein [Luteimonas aquatica]
MQRFVVHSFAVFLSLSGNAPASEPQADARAAGETKEFPIEVCKPQGEHDYLSRLACENGAEPAFERLGNYGERTPLPKNLPRAEFDRMFESAMRYEPLRPGEADHHIVDGYQFVCGAQKRIIYLDMYHCDGKGSGSSLAEVSAATCEGEPGCLDKVAKYCADLDKHKADVYSEVFDRGRLTYFLENVVGASVAKDYKVNCDGIDFTNGPYPSLKN